MRSIHAQQESGLEIDEGDMAEPRALVTLVFEALHSLEERENGCELELAAGAPRVCLTLLTYAYAIGVFASEEIERQTKQDGEFTYLAARTTVTATDLRQFRRYHQAQLRRSLGLLLEMVWRERRKAIFDLPGLDIHTPSGPGELSTYFEGVADRRIQEAMLADTMAMDI